jgi:microcin C transport system substrate-binding protein
LTIRAHFTRRRFMAYGAAAASLPLLPAGRAFAAPETGKPLHGISTFGDLKYGPDFTHFDYASPHAPQGGTFNFSVPNWLFNQSPLSFNTLNTWVPRGDAPPRVELTHDTLMTGSLDEPDSLYGLLAESITISDDRNVFTFRIRPEARFHDGTPVTADDAAFTFNILKEKGHPQLQLPLAEMVEAVAEGQDFRVTFSGKQNSQTVFTVAGYPVLSKAWFEANPFDGSQLRAPLGNGAYKVGRFSAGNYVEYEKVADYWGKDLAVNRGLNHFQIIRVEFYRERQAGFEAFKKGDILFRQEFTARVWATEYDFPALRENKVVKREFPGDLRPSMQAWAVNQRRERFRDPRAREAINLCFDFQWSNRNLFYDAYERAESCFEKSEFKAEGMPSPEELALLEPLRADIPEAAFGEAVKMPVSDGSGRDRTLFRRARELLGELGWKPDGSLLKNGRGETFKLELLAQDEVFVRVYSPFVENMRAVGIDASIRVVDPAQYQARQVDFDYDVVGMAQSFTGTPTRSQLNNTFGSDAADVGSSRNYPGTKSKAIDALIEAAGKAETRAELVTAIRALDRVLRARLDWIPNWFAATHKAAYWDMFGFKDPKPDYGFPVESLWWRDEEKAKAIGKA